MSDKGKGKASSSRKRKRPQDPTFTSLLAYAQNPLNEIEKSNQMLPALDGVKFPICTVNSDSPVTIQRI
ncbi:hypothetical protein AHAS_Ahas05G0156400 [Arachis hypogaea]